VNEVPVSEIPGRAPVPLAENDTWVTTAALQQLVYSGGRVSAQVRQAGDAAEAARAARLRTRQLVAFGAERAFRLLLATQGETDVAAQNLAAPRITCGSPGIGSRREPRRGSTCCAPRWRSRRRARR
jgi:outer membrane protein TolC